MFLSMCNRVGVAITRIPDGCTQIGQNKIIRVKTPFDWIVTHQGKTALIDTKTVGESTFPHSRISDHQVHSMVHHELRGAKSGYVIWMRTPNRVLYVSGVELENLSRVPGSIKLNQSNVKLLGQDTYFDVRLLFA